MDHEEEFLNSFFIQVTQLCFDKAKESVNSLKTMYESLKGDLKRVEEMTKGTNAVGATVAEVSNQLCQFVTARLQLMDFYEKMYTMSICNRPMNHPDLLQTIDAIILSHSLSCCHLALTAIKAALTLECEILAQLMKAHVEIQNWKFLPSLMALYGAQARMSAWERTLQNKESWKLGFGATFLKTNQQPALYQWLLKLRSAILSKCSLYFHTTLCQQATSGEMRSIMSRQNVDYYHKLQSFQRKYDVLAVLLVFDSRGTQDSGPGYRHPKRELEVGDDFSLVLCCPSVFLQKPLSHWDNIKESIHDRYADLKTMDKIIFSNGQNQKEFYTYAMYNIDPRMTLVTVFESGKQKDKAPYVTTFLTDLGMQLRCNKIYESLKISK